MHSSGDKDDSKGCVIRLIHYILSDKLDFDEYYLELSKKEVINPLDLKYTFPIFKMCYKYYKYNEIPDSIIEVLKEGLLMSDKKYIFGDFSIVKLKRDEFSTEIVLNDISNIHLDENEKINKDLSVNISNFIRDNIYAIRIQNCFKITSLIYSIDGNVIGYKYIEDEICKKKFQNILDIKFDSQHQLICFFKSLVDEVVSINDTLKNNITKKDEQFNLEDSIEYHKDNNFFKVDNIEKLYDISRITQKSLWNSIILLFFKLYSKYIFENYGDIKDEKELLKIDEIKLLPPVVSRGYINFVLGNNEDYSKLKNSLYKFLNNNKTAIINNKEVSYYQKFNPEAIKITFDFEIEKIINFENDSNEFALADGKRFIGVENNNDINILLNSLEKNKEKLEKIFVEDNIMYKHQKNIKFVGISEIIYSTEILDDGMYKILGYIKDEVKGEPLINEKIIQLSNKDFIYLTVYVFSKFNEQNFYLDLINIDDDMNFYIDLTNKIALKNSSQKRKYVISLLEMLKNEGLDISKFENIDYSISDEELIELADSMNSYCNKHNLYYNSEKQNLCSICSKTLFDTSKLNYEIYNKVVYEDEYAIHYELDNKYNFKKYKPQKVDFDMLEKVIEKIVLSSDKENSNMFKQDLFIPVKKAVDLKKNKFVGYIYNKVEFDKENNSFINLNNLNNLLKIKGCIILIKQLNGKDFIYNPFGSVFISKNHRKQVQLTNPEFIINARYNNMDKFIVEYIESILNTDEDMKIDFTGYSNLDSVLLNLEQKRSELTKYCHIHKLYYNKNYIFCPKCNMGVKNNPVYVTPQNIKSWNELNEGGEAIIYDYSKLNVAKKFKDDVDLNFKTSILLKIFERKEILDSINKSQNKYRYIFPKNLLVDKNENKIVRLYYGESRRNTFIFIKK